MPCTGRHLCPRHNSCKQTLQRLLHEARPPYTRLDITRSLSNNVEDVTMVVISGRNKSLESNTSLEFIPADVTSPSSSRWLLAFHENINTTQWCLSSGTPRSKRSTTSLAKSLKTPLLDSTNQSTSTPGTANKSTSKFKVPIIILAACLATDFCIWNDLAAGEGDDAAEHKEGNWCGLQVERPEEQVFNVSVDEEARSDDW